MDVPAFHWPLVESVAWAESSFRADAVSPAGAKGLLQILDGTFAEIQQQVPGLQGHSPFDPEISISAGCYYLRRCWNFWTEPRTPQEQMRFALASYNAGAGNVLRAQRLARSEGLSGDWDGIARTLGRITGPANAKETTDYVGKILPRYQARKQELGLGHEAVACQVLVDANAPVKFLSTGMAQSVSFTPEQEANMEAAVASLGVSSLMELLGHNMGYKVGLLILAIIVGVYVPPWAFRVWDRTLPYNTAELIQHGHRLPAFVVLVQMVGIFAVIITALILLH